MLPENVVAAVVSLQNRITHAVLDHLHVEHGPPAEMRRAQTLIVLATITIAIAWLNLAAESLALLKFAGTPVAHKRLLYFLLNVAFAAIQSLPVMMARRRQITGGAVLYLSSILIGIVGLSVSGGMSLWGQNMMAGLMILIPLAGVLLRPSMSMVTGFALCLLETVLLYFFDPFFPRYILASMYVYNLTLGALMWGIRAPIEIALQRADEQAHETHVTQEARMRAAVKWLRWHLIHYANETLRSPIEQALVQLNTAVEIEGPALSIASREAIDEAYTRLRQVLRGWDHQLALTPMGAIRIALHSIDYPLFVMVRRTVQDFNTINPAVEVVMHSEADAPEFVFGPAVVMRHVVYEAIDFWRQYGSNGPITLTLTAAGADRWALRVTGSRVPARLPDLLRHSVRRNDAARTAMDELQLWIESSGGALLVEGRAEMPQSLTLTFPLRMINPEA
jgi:hypothetical protein